MRTMRVIAAAVAMTMIAAACGTTSSSPALDTILATTTTQLAAGTTLAGTGTTGATTTTTAGVTELDLSIEPTGWTDVTVTTEDGIDLYARHWPGNDVAVLATHDFDNPNPGSAGQRAAQSSEGLLPYTAALARQGYTVVSPDFRGHGESGGGDYDVRASQLDLAAVYAWLEAQGHETIVLVGWAGSATAGVVLDAEREDVAFDGIAMLFSPPQDTGLDAGAVIGEIDAPTLFIGSNAGQSASWAKRLEARAANPAGVFVFERVPSGVTFFDLFGAELAGRIADFIASI